MASKAILAIQIVSDASKAARELDGITAKTSKMGRVSSAAGKAFAAGLLLVGAAAVKAGNAAAADEREAARLAQTLRKAAGATDAQVAATERWITAQGKALGVSDSELRPAISRLAVATGDLGEAQRLASLAMNVAAGSGKSLKSVTEALAKGVNGSLTGLSRLGVATKNADGSTKSLEQITRKLAATYKGAAANAAETTAGKQERLKVRMEELQESIGQRVIPVLLALTTAGLAVVGWLEKNQTVALIILGTIGALVGIVAAYNVALKVSAAVQAAWAVATKAAAVAQKIFNAALRANPIGLIITAVLLLVAGFVLLYKRSDKFRAIVQAVGRAGKAAIGWIVDRVSDLVGWVKDRLPGAFNLAKNLIVGYLKLVTLPLRTIIDVVKRIIEFVRDKAPAAFNAFKVIAVNVGNAILAPFRALYDFIVGIIQKIKEIKVPDLVPDLTPWDGLLPGRSISSGTSTGGVSVAVSVPGGFVGSESELARVLAPAISTELARISVRTRT